MTWDQISGSVMEIRGKVREWWGRWTQDDETVIKGRKQQLIGLMQQRFGDKVNEIEQQIGSFERHVAHKHR